MSCDAYIRLPFTFIVNPYFTNLVFETTTIWFLKERGIRSIAVETLVRFWRKGNTKWIIVNLFN